MNAQPQTPLCKAPITSAISSKPMDLSIAFLMLYSSWPVTILNSSFRTNFAAIAWRTEVMVHRMRCRRILGVPLVRVRTRLAFALPLGCRQNGPVALRYKAHFSKGPQLRLSRELNPVTSGRTIDDISSYTRRW